MSKITFLLAFFVSAVILLGVSYFAYVTFADFEHDAKWVAHTQRVKNEINIISSYPNQFSREIRNELIRLDTLHNDGILPMRENINAHLAVLDSLVSDNPKQQRYVRKLTTLNKQYLDVGYQLATSMSGDYEIDRDMRNLIEKEEILLDSINIYVSDIKNGENKLLITRSEQARESQFMAPATLLTLVIIAISIISFLFINTFSLFKLNEQKAETLQQKVVELNTEIDERKKFQNLLRSVFDSAPFGITYFSAIRDEENKIIDFKYEMVNNNWKKIVGYSGEDLLGKTLLEITPGNKDAGIFDQYIDVVENGDPMSTELYYKYDDIEGWYEISAVKNKDGFVVVFGDITTKKLHELGILEKKKELEAMNYELEQFAYVASHDLQEPLRKVQAFGDRLATTYQDKLDERGVDYVRRMQNAANRMQVLITDLLKVSRASRADRDFKPVNLNEICKDVMVNLSHEIDAKEATINISRLPTIPGNAVLLSQLFHNLLSNSLKYSKKDLKPIIDIDAQEIDNFENNTLQSELNYWKISVKDNGIGFDSKYKEQIFATFKRLHGRTEYEGTGIGLALCAKIVQHHYGVIEAEGMLGEGAVFSIYLPKQQLNA